MKKLRYVGSLSSAREFGEQGRIEDWIHEYLLSDGNNKALSDGLSLEHRSYIGPIEIGTSLLRRCCGPEKDMRFRVNAAGFERKVAALMAATAKKDDLPPLIVNYTQGELVLNDGNHRFEARLRLGLEVCHVIVWTTGSKEYDEFIEKYIKDEIDLVARRRI